MSVRENTQQLESLRNRLKITHIFTLSLYHSLSLFLHPTPLLFSDTDTNVVEKEFPQSPEVLAGEQIKMTS